MRLSPVEAPFLDIRPDGLEVCIAGPGRLKQIDADHNLPSGITPSQSIGAFRAAFPDAVVTVEDVVGEGDRVAIRYTLRGANTGPFFGMPPMGRSIEIGGISLYRLADGKMQEAWVQYDQLGIMQQLGLAPSPQVAATV